MTIRELIKTAIQENPPMTAWEIATHIKKHKQSVRVILSQMKDMGEINTGEFKKCSIKNRMTSTWNYSDTEISKTSQ